MNVACGYTIPITLFGIPPSPADNLKGIDIVGKAGFKALEMELYDELIPEHRRDLPAMKALFAQHGMKAPSVMAVEEKMFSLDPATKRQALSDFDALSDLIVDLGAPLVTICGYMPPEIRPEGTQLYTGGPPTAVRVSDDFSWPRFWENAVDVVRQCAAIAKAKKPDPAHRDPGQRRFQLHRRRHEPHPGHRRHQHGRDPGRGPRSRRQGVPGPGHPQAGRAHQAGALLRQRRHAGLPLRARRRHHRLRGRDAQPQARGLRRHHRRGRLRRAQYRGRGGQGQGATSRG